MALHRRRGGRSATRRPAGRGRRRGRPRRVQPVHLLIAAIGAAALLLVAGPVPALDRPVGPHWALLGALTLGFVAAERFLVQIPARPNAHTLTFAELPLVLGLFFAPPLYLVGAHLVGAGAALALEREMSAVRRVFNLAQYALSTSLALVFFQVFGGRPGGDSLVVADWASALAAVLLSSAVSVALIVAAMTVTGDRPSRHRLLYMLSAGLGVSTTNTSLALLAAFITFYDPAALVLLVIPVGVVFASYRAYVAQYRRTRQVEFLNRATRDLVAAGSVEEGLARLLDHLLATFHCNLAEVVLLSGGPGGDVLRLTQRGSERGELVPVTGEAAARLTRLAQGESARGAAFPKSASGAVDGPDRAAAEVPADALTARLVDEDGVIGLLVVGDPADSAAQLGADDAKLLDTLAHQAATLLRYDRLEQAFARLRAEQDRLRHQALHDQVTGLGNRRLLDGRLTEALAAGRPLAMILLDLDDFKAVNDSLGHAAGDELLMAAGQRMRRNVRPDDLVVRLGGDEFALLLLDPDSQAEAEPVAERVLASLGQPFMVAGRSAQVGASVGLATADGGGAVGAAELLAQADGAMYEAKRAGKGQVRCWQGHRPAA